jgi:hypothetical protein
MSKLKKITRIGYPFLFVILISVWQLPLSPLYKYTDFVDIPTMMDMAKAMIHGLVPFRDVFEQRGPYMYMINLISCLPGNSIHWVWVLELINFGILYALFYKTARLTVNEKHSKWLACISVILIPISSTFNQGAAPEEFMLVPTIYLFYVILKMATNNRKDPTTIENFLLGLGLSWIVFVKYSNIGAIATFFVVYGLILLKNKRFKLFGKTVLTSVSGLIVGSLPAFAYFGYNHTIGVFLKSYFIENTGATNQSVVHLLKNMIAPTLVNIASTISIICIILIPLIFGMARLKNYYKLLSLSSMLGLAITTGMIMRIGISYGLALSVILIELALYGYKKMYHYVKHARTPYKVTLVIVMIFTLGGILKLTNWENNSQALIGIRIVTPEQYRRANTLKYSTDIQQSKLINTHGNGKILVFNDIPTNIFTYNKEYPKFKYFDQTTIPYKSQPVAANSQIRYITKKEPKWITTRISGIIAKNNTQYQKKIKKLSKTVKNDNSDQIATITANTERSNKYQSQYDILYKQLDTVIAQGVLPKVLLKNYVLISIGTNTLISLTNHDIKPVSLLFIRKDDLKKYPDLKPVHYMKVQYKKSMS